MTNLISDFRLALRTLWKAPLFTTLTMVSLALGIGANTTIFTLLDQVVLRKLPVERPDELVQLQIDGTFNGNSWGNGTEISYPMYQDFRDRNEVFSGMFARFEWPMHCRHRAWHRAGDRRAGVRHVFPDSGRDRGRGPTVHARRRSRDRWTPVAVLSHRLLEDAILGRPGVIGRKLTVNSHPFTVIGVAAAGFSGIDVGTATQVFVPMMMKAQMTPGWNFLDDRRARFARVFARLKPGTTAASAAVGLQPLFKAQRAEELKAPVLHDRHRLDASASSCVRRSRSCRRRRGTRASRPT